MLSPSTFSNLDSKFYFSMPENLFAQSVTVKFSRVDGGVVCGRFDAVVGKNLAVVHHSTTLIAEPGSSSEMNLNLDSDAGFVNNWPDSGIDF